MKQGLVNAGAALNSAAAACTTALSAHVVRSTPVPENGRREMLGHRRRGLAALACHARLACVQVAVDGEVLAAMSNINYATPGGMLDTWMEGVKRAGVKNAMVIALDAMTKANAEKFGIPAFEMHVQARADSAPCLTYEQLPACVRR